MWRVLTLICLLMVGPAFAQTGSPKTPTALNTEINSLFADNTTGLITPFDVRQVALDQVSSFGNTSVANTWAALQTFSAGTIVSGPATFNGLSSFAGQIVSTFGTPSISNGACGAGANGSVAGTNQSGAVTIGAAATTTCTITFSTTITPPNACVLFPGNAAAAATGTTVAWVGAPSANTWVLNGAALANTIYRYICL